MSTVHPKRFALLWFGSILVLIMFITITQRALCIGEIHPEMKDKYSIRTWASYQIRKIAGCACAVNAENVLPRHRLQRWRGKRSQQSRCMHNLQCCVSGKRPIQRPTTHTIVLWSYTYINYEYKHKTITNPIMETANVSVCLYSIDVCSWCVYICLASNDLALALYADLLRIVLLMVTVIFLCDMNKVRQPK